MLLLERMRTFLDPNECLYIDGDGDGDLTLTTVYERGDVIGVNMRVPARFGGSWA